MEGTHVQGTFVQGEICLGGTHVTAPSSELAAKIKQFFIIQVEIIKLKMAWIPTIRCSAFSFSKLTDSDLVQYFVLDFER